MIDGKQQDRAWHSLGQTWRPLGRPGVPWVPSPKTCSASHSEKKCNKCTEKIKMYLPGNKLSSLALLGLRLDQVMKGYWNQYHLLAVQEGLMSSYCSQVDSCLFSTPSCSSLTRKQLVGPWKNWHFIGWYWCWLVLIVTGEDCIREEQLKITTLNGHVLFQ